MSIFKKNHSWIFSPEKVMEILKGDWKDELENRSYRDYKDLVLAANWKEPNYKLGIKLCKKQIKLTPDFDAPYSIISEHQILKHEHESAIATLCEGIKVCKSKYYLLSKLGEIYFKLEKPMVSIVFFTKALISQNPSFSDYIPFLFFSYYCQFSGYGNASIYSKNISDKISRRDYGSELDFEQSQIYKIQSLVVQHNSEMLGITLNCIDEITRRLGDLRYLGK